MSFKFTKPAHNTDKSRYSMSGDFITVHAHPSPDTPAEISAKWRIEPCFMTAKYAQFAEAIHNFEVRPDDIWIVSYPKCGTTWTLEMIWMLNNDLNYETATTVSLNARHQYPELNTLMEMDWPGFGDSLELTAAAESPRLIKTHLPVALLPKQLWTVRPRIVYVARNAMDTAVSFYHHYRHIQGYEGTFDDFMEIFLADEVVYSPFHSHIVSFWNLRDEENLFFVTYEEMKTGLFDVLQRAARFLGKSYTVEQLRTLEMHLSFDVMRLNKCANMSDMTEHIEDTEFQ